MREGHLWRADGTLLATVTFTSGAGPGRLADRHAVAPVALTAGTRICRLLPDREQLRVDGGYFSMTNEVAFDGVNNNAFWGPFGVIRVVQDGVGGGNGVFIYGCGAAVIPTQSFNASNYWVDITFDPVRRAGELGPDHHLGRDANLAENRLIVGTITATDADGNPLTYAIAGGADAARFTINAADRAAALRHHAEFRGPGRRGRQQRLQADSERQRRHRRRGDQGDHRHRHRPGRERQPARTSSARPTRRRRPRQPTRPTTSSA